MAYTGTAGEPIDWGRILTGGMGARPPAAMPGAGRATPFAPVQPGVDTSFGTPQDWLQGIDASKQAWWMKPAQDILIGAGNSVYPTLAGVGGPASGLAFTNLLDILSRRGKTDPALMNRDLTSIARGTEAAQRGVQGNLASMGLQGSGLGQALSAAVGESGQERKSQYMAEQTAREEQQRRKDLELFMRMIMDPSERAMAMGLGEYNQQMARDAQQSAAKLAFWGDLAKAAGSAVPG